MAIQFTRFTLLIASLYSLSAQIAFVQATTTTSSAPATTSTGPATIYPGTSQWAYYGCYNETTLTNGTNGLRALNGGVNEALDSMTVDMCLAFCQSNMYSFAGLEYTRECYCSSLVSALSAHLPDSSCNLPCEGNSTQICGGSLTLSVYQAKTATKGAGIKAVRTPFDGVGSILALGIAVGGLLCLA